MAECEFFAMKPSDFTWHVNEGDWNRDENGTVHQTVLDTGSRNYIDFDRSNFVLDVTFKIDESVNVRESGRPEAPYMRVATGEGIPIGEAKIIFSDAERDESYRIDFMSQNVCRITSGRYVSYGTPFAVSQNTEIPVQVKVKNNFTSIRADGIELISNYQFGKKSNGKIGLGTYLARVTFSNFNLRPLESRTCFVVMRYDTERDFLYELVIKKVLENHPIYDFKVERADELSTVGRISMEIMEKIKNANLIIADVSDENKNVFYEIGLTHAWEQKVILLKDSKDFSDIPFDLRDFRYYPYDYTPGGFERLRNHLEELVTNLLKQ